MGGLILDVTGRNEIKQNDLVAVPNSTYSGSPYLDFGVVTRFTAKRVYYKYIKSTRVVPIPDPDYVESWKPLNHSEKFLIDENGNFVQDPNFDPQNPYGGNRYLKVRSVDRVAEMFLLQRDVALEALTNYTLQLNYARN